MRVEGRDHGVEKSLVDHSQHLFGELLTASRWFVRAYVPHVDAECFGWRIPIDCDFLPEGLFLFIEPQDASALRSRRKKRLTRKA